MYRAKGLSHTIAQPRRWTSLSLLYRIQHSIVKVLKIQTTKTEGNRTSSTFLDEYGRTVVITVEIRE